MQWYNMVERGVKNINCSRAINNPGPFMFDRKVEPNVKMIRRACTVLAPIVTIFEFTSAAIVWALHLNFSKFKAIAIVNKTDLC